MVDRERIDRRSNIGPQARSFHKEGYALSPQDPLSKTYERNSPEVIEVWRNNKPERNALTAVLVDRIIDKALDLREEIPPVGLSVIDFDRIRVQAVDATFLKDAKAPYDVVRDGLARTLTLALTHEINTLEKMQEDDTNTDPITSVFARYKKIIQFGNEYVYPSEKKLQQLLINGIGSATEVSVGIMELVPQVYSQSFSGKDMNPEELTDIVRGSYPITVDLAASHISEFIYKRRTLGENTSMDAPPYRYDPKLFSLDTSQRNPRLVIKDDVKDEFKQTLSSYEHDTSFTIATGCPALVRFDEASAVRKLWDWNTEIAQFVYSELYKDTSAQQYAD